MGEAATVVAETDLEAPLEEVEIDTEALVVPEMGEAVTEIAAAPDDLDRDPHHDEAAGPHPNMMTTDDRSLSSSSLRWLAFSNCTFLLPFFSLPIQISLSCSYQ